MATTTIPRNLASRKKGKSIGAFKSKLGTHANDPFILKKEKSGKAFIAKYGLPTELIKADRARTKSSRG
jgi:hypothetical protein